MPGMNLAFIGFLDHLFNKGCIRILCMDLKRVGSERLMKLIADRLIDHTHQCADSNCQ